MNKERRKNLAKIVEALNELYGKVEDQMSELQSVHDEEQEYFDNMPEGIQSGSKGDKVTEDIQQMSEASDAMSEAMNWLQTASSTLEGLTDE